MNFRDGLGVETLSLQIPSDVSHCQGHWFYSIDNIISLHINLPCSCNCLLHPVSFQWYFVYEFVLL